jgi:hypothetical protein
VLRFEPDGLPLRLPLVFLRSGQIALAVGSGRRFIAALGIVSLAGGTWHSRRGGTIDNLFA